MGNILWGVYLVPGGVPGPRGYTWSWGVYIVPGGVPGVGGVPGPGRCTWSQGGVPGPMGGCVPGPRGGVPGQVLSPPCEQNHTHL